MNPLTHFDAQGQAHMVDVAAKAATHRVAVASGRIEMLPATLALIEAGNAKKGDVLGIARIAGIQGAKKTSDLIPLCPSRQGACHANRYQKRSCQRLTGER